MAISYRILKDRGLVIITSSGETDLKETIRLLGQMYADPEHSMEYDLLWDASGVTSTFTYEDMHRLLEHYKRYSGDRSPKRAIVASSSDTYGGIKILWEMISVESRAQIGLFYDRKEALKWLGH